MATNMPPHNLREVIGAAVEVLDNPDATLEDLMRHVHGPDFPTKGIILGRAGIRAAYATGRGKITIRARAEFEEHGANRTRIIVTELPYQVNKKQLIKNIADQVKDKRLEDISDLRDESDRNGMRIVIELKRDANPQVVLNKLFAQTALQSSFSIINLALVNDQSQPKILSLRHILDEYLTFQEEVITRRTKFDLRKARERAHLLEGLRRVMQVCWTETENFRLLEPQRVEFSPGVNVITGENAQGKTTLLETVYLLSGAKSFRTSYDRELVAFGKEQAALTGSFHALGREQKLSVLFWRGRARQMKLNGVRTGAAGMRGALKAILFSPDDLGLVRGPAAGRRKLMDAAISQLRPGYLGDLAEKASASALDLKKKSAFR